MDCSCTDAFQLHRATYLAVCDAVVLVYSATKAESLEHLTTWATEVVAARNGDIFTKCYRTAAEAEAATATASGKKTIATHVDRPPGVVPIFVVGTNGDTLLSLAFPAKGSATSPTTSVASTPTSNVRTTAAPLRRDSDGLPLPLFSRAESITEKCLCEMGFGVAPGEDGTSGIWEGGHLIQGDGKKRRKKLGKISGLVRKLFSGHSSASKIYSSEAAGKTRSPAASEQEFTALPVNEKAVSSADHASVPPGASLRMPLYQLSTRDNAAVTRAFRAVLSLHMLIRRAEAAPSPVTSPSTTANSTQHFPLTRTVGSESHSLLNHKHLRMGSGVSNCSHQSERSAASFLPTMGSLYDLDGLLDGAAETTRLQKKQRSDISEGVNSQHSAVPSDGLQNENSAWMDGVLIPVTAATTTPHWTSIRQEKLGQKGSGTASVVYAGSEPSCHSKSCGRVTASLNNPHVLSSVPIHSVDNDGKSPQQASAEIQSPTIQRCPPSPNEIPKVGTVVFVTDDIALSAAPHGEEAPHHLTSALSTSGNYSTKAHRERDDPPDCPSTKVPDRRRCGRPPKPTALGDVRPLDLIPAASGVTTNKQLRYDVDKMVVSDLSAAAAQRLDLSDCATLSVTPDNMSNAANGLSSTFVLSAATVLSLPASAQLDVVSPFCPVSGQASPPLSSLSPPQKCLPTESGQAPFIARNSLPEKKHNCGLRPLSPSSSSTPINSPSPRGDTDAQKYNVTRCEAEGCIIM